jgi:hypothetical protein
MIVAQSVGIVDDLYRHCVKMSQCTGLKLTSCSALETRYRCSLRGLQAPRLLPRLFLPASTDRGHLLRTLHACIMSSSHASNGPVATGHGLLFSRRFGQHGSRPKSELQAIGCRQRTPQAAVRASCCVKHPLIMLCSQRGLGCKSNRPSL